MLPLPSPQRRCCVQIASACDIRLDASQAVSTADAALRPDRRIALLKPTAAVDERIMHALQLLDSVLWAFRGTLHSNWQVASIDTADVIVFHEGDTDERIAQWKSQGKPFVEIATQSRLDSDAVNLLVYPFRAAQVLTLLERLETQLASSLDSPILAASELDTSAPVQDPWSFVEGLLTLRSVENSAAWLVAREARTRILWLRGDAATYTAEPHIVQAIRRGTLNLNRLTLQTGLAPAGGQAPRSGMELSWFAGYHASDQLAPSLKPTSVYRITSWPNFGLIRPSGSQMRIAARLASVGADLEEITRRAGVTVEEAARSLNALHACGVLTEVDPSAAQATASTTARRPIAVPEPRAGLGKFLAQVRRHFGLGGGA